MVYKVIIYEKSVEKDYVSVMANFSQEVKKKALNHLKNTPFIGKKRKQFYKYDLPQGNRMLYLILAKSPTVRIVCIGDHNHYMKHLKKYGKKI